MAAYATRLPKLCRIIVVFVLVLVLVLVIVGGNGGGSSSREGGAAASAVLPDAWEYSPTSSGQLDAAHCCRRCSSARSNL